MTDCLKGAILLLNKKYKANQRDYGQAFRISESLQFSLDSVM